MPLDLTAHWPLPIGHGSRELGTLLALGHPTVYQLAGALTSLGQELTNWYCVRHVLCSCLHSLSFCLLPASSLRHWQLQ